MLTTFSAVRFGSGRDGRVPNLNQDNPQDGQPVVHHHHQAPNPPVPPPQRQYVNVDDVNVQRDEFNGRVRNENEGVQPHVLRGDGQAAILRNILRRNLANQHGNNPQGPDDQG